MSTPRVNQQISGGRCAITGLIPEEVNLPFKNAEKVVNQKLSDTIDVIEIDY